MEKEFSLIFGGDVMLGRLVKLAINEYGVDYPLGHIHSILKHADLTIMNLECAITDSTDLWSGDSKAFYFGAPSLAATALLNANIHLVSLANNHSLDFDFQGLKDTFTHLQKKHILYVGAGNNLSEAVTPIILERGGIKFGMAAFCDHQSDFAATDNRAGIAYLDLENESHAISQFAESLSTMFNHNVTMPILSLHWGPNGVHRPSPFFVKLAHQAIDLGYKIIFGHSAHVFHGIEIYRNAPIIYSAGDLVDDYYVDEELKNDHQVIIECVIENTRVKRILLHPVFIEQCRVQPTTGEQFDFISQRITQLCHEMGTTVIQNEKHFLSIDLML